VRFVVGDLVQVNPSITPRWTCVPALASVEGRIDEAIVRPDGALVTAGALDRSIGALEGVRLWQVNQREPDAVLVDVVAADDKARVVESVRERLAALLPGMTIAARSVAAIPIEPSGKFRVAKRHFPLELSRYFEGCDGAPT
jgi:phenylacetate-CoA ligase